MRFLGKLAQNEKPSFERFQGEVVTGLVRAHGLIFQVQHSHRWQLTSHGQTLAALTTAARKKSSPRDKLRARRQALDG